MRLGNLMRTAGLGAALTLSVAAAGCDDEDEETGDAGTDGGGAMLDAAVVDAPTQDASSGDAASPGDSSPG